MKTLTTVFCMVAIVALYGCGGSSYLSESPSEGSGITPVSIQSGALLPSSLPKVAKDDSYYTDGSTSSDSSFFGLCSAIDYTASASVQNFILINDAYGTIPEILNLNADPAKTCALDSSTPNNCLTRIETIDDYGASTFEMVGNLLCSEAAGWHLEYDVVIENVIISTQEDAHGVISLFAGKIVGGANAAGITIDMSKVTIDLDDAYGNGSCNPDNPDVLGVDFAWVPSLELPEGAWLDAIDKGGLAEDSFMLDTAVTDASQLDAGGMCTVTMTLPVAVDFSSCVGEEMFIAASEVDLIGRGCVVTDFTTCDGSDMVGLLPE